MSEIVNYLNCAEYPVCFWWKDRGNYNLNKTIINKRMRSARHLDCRSARHLDFKLEGFIIDTRILPRIGYKTYIINSNKLKVRYKIIEVSQNKTRFKMRGINNDELTVYISKEGIWRVLKSREEVHIVVPGAVKHKKRKPNFIVKKISKFLKFIGL